MHGHPSARRHPGRRVRGGLVSSRAPSREQATEIAHPQGPIIPAAGSRPLGRLNLRHQVFHQLSLPQRDCFGRPLRRSQRPRRRRRRRRRRLATAPSSRDRLVTHVDILVVHVHGVLDRRGRSGGRRRRSRCGSGGHPAPAFHRALDSLDPLECGNEVCAGHLEL